MAKRIVVLIDGGFLRENSRRAGIPYNPDFIERFAQGCTIADEEILRILYYDCALYTGTVTLPVSGDPKIFTASDAWLQQLARKDLFAVRRGVLKFRGFKPKRTPVAQAAQAAPNPIVQPAAIGGQAAAGAQVTDDDFYPDFEQKGVDMRIGLDIASYSAHNCIERIVLVSGDTDCVPAMKHGRKAGLQIVIVQLPNTRVPPELLMHSDFKRIVAWP